LLPHRGLILAHAERSKGVVAIASDDQGYCRRMQKGPRRVLAGIMVVLGIATGTALAQEVILTGTDGDDVLNGTAAGEAIYARAGNDTVNAGAGDDELDGGTGADLLNGGDGSDSVAYGGIAGVDVSLDGAANDGAVGEGDNVATDVEDVFGADGADKLVGSAAVNTIDGSGGDDRITGGAGKDALFGGDGDDVIDSRDREVDRVECGAGNDTATIDRGDIVLADCERRAKPAVTITPGLTILSARKRLIVSSIVAKSTIVIACVTGCHPASAPTKAIITRSLVKLDAGRTVRLRLPKRISGATIELGVTAPGADTTCVRYRIGRQYSSLRVLKRVSCTTIARSSRS
jgi:hypothetical protein